jgi:hypothetical protein
MRKFFNILGVSLIATMSASTIADVVVDGQTIDESDIYSITIGPLSGDLFITSQTMNSTGNPGFAVTEVTANTNSVAINSLNRSPSSIVAGGSVTIDWSTTNANSCSGSGGFNSWSGSLPVNGSDSYSTSTPGNYTFTLTCTDSSGGSATRSVSVSVTEQNSSVQIDSFFASPGSITAGGSSTLTWSTSNASSCTASGGFGGWNGSSIGTSGSKSVSTSAQNTYTFTLKCFDSSGGSDTETTTVTVTDANTQCSSSLSGVTYNWEDIMGKAFPYVAKSRRDVQIPRNGYIALKFNTGAVQAKGAFSTTQVTQTSGSRYGALSTCPGDWDVTRWCKKGWGISGGMPWSTKGISTYCNLEPHTTYYFNLTFTNGSSAGSTTCDASPCVTTLVYSATVD